VLSRTNEPPQRDGLVADEGGETGRRGEEQHDARGWTDPKHGQEAHELDEPQDGAARQRSTVKIFESYVDPTSMQDSYRYFFGVWYAARTISLLPEKKREKYAKRLRDAIRPLQELDGSFADSLMIGKASSTALALLALAELRATR